MLDKNKKEIKEGDLIKLVGMVQYADGLKEKISKKTWIFEGELPEKTDDMQYLVVGNTETGLSPEYLPFQEGVITIDAGSVPVKYKVLKDIPEKGWEKGDVVQITGKVSKETLENGFLEQVDDKTPHKHVLVVVDPIATGLAVNKPK